LSIYLVGVEDSIGGPTNSRGFFFLETGLKDHVRLLSGVGPTDLAFGVKIMAPGVILTFTY